MENINNLNWELLDIDDENNVNIQIDEPKLYVNTDYEHDIDELEENLNIENVYDFNNILYLEDLNLIENKDEIEIKIKEKVNNKIELNIQLYEDELEREAQEEMFLKEMMEQKQLDEYIKDEEEYKKYEEEMFLIYNKENEKHFEEIEYLSNTDENSDCTTDDESSEESTDKSNNKQKKYKTKLNRILDNKFLLFLGLYLIYEIMYGSD